MEEHALICMVEMPMGSRYKYEYDGPLGAIRFDRFVSASVVIDDARRRFGAQGS
jgi:inorganic pyrophosphatase